MSVSTPLFNGIFAPVTNGVNQRHNPAVGGKDLIPRFLGSPTVDGNQSTWAYRAFPVYPVQSVELS